MKKNNDLKILVVTHKQYEFPKNKIYIPIQVNSNKLKDLGFLKDNDGDNIADKNSNYCELTALYWAWKNLKCDYIGINHYRRYLSFHDSSDLKNAKTMQDKFNLILNADEINCTMNDYDLIAPTTKLFTKNVYSKYAQQHYKKDMDSCRKVIEKKYPDYISSFDKVMKNKEYCICNMCVMKKEKFDEYCKWLFDVLFEVEKITDISNYSPLQKRIYGFLSERLFNVWIDKNNIKMKKANIVSMEHDSLKTLYNKAWHRLLHKRL